MHRNVFILLFPAALLTACHSSGPFDKAAEPPKQQSSLQSSTTASGYGCSMNIAGGPPPKPAKGADFGKAAAKNVGKNISRSLLSNIGARVAGPLGGAVASGVATSTIRQEQDLSGKWTATDGKPDCGCTVEIRSATNLNLKTSNKGRAKSADCRNTGLVDVARWKLGHSFTGYNASFELLAKDRRTVLATLNRDGVNYFSGTMADGTPVTLWRRGG